MKFIYDRLRDTNTKVPPKMLPNSKKTLTIVDTQAGYVMRAAILEIGSLDLILTVGLFL